MDRIYTADPYLLSYSDIAGVYLLCLVEMLPCHYACLIMHQSLKKGGISRIP